MGNKKIVEKEFEDYWKAHKYKYFLAAPAALREERENSGKMNTAGDWILFCIPLVIMVHFLDHKIVANEIGNFLIVLVIGAAAFYPMMLIKPYVTGKRNVVDIEEDIKQHFYRIYQEKGLKGLEDSVTV